MVVPYPDIETRQAKTSKMYKKGTLSEYIVLKILRKRNRSKRAGKRSTRKSTRSKKPALSSSSEDATDDTTEDTPDATGDDSGDTELNTGTKEEAVRRRSKAREQVSTGGGKSKALEIETESHHASLADQMDQGEDDENQGTFHEDMNIEDNNGGGTVLIGDPSSTPSHGTSYVFGGNFKVRHTVSRFLSLIGVNKICNTFF